MKVIVTVSFEFCLQRVLLHIGSLYFWVAVIFGEIRNLCILNSSQTNVAHLIVRNLKIIPFRHFEYVSLNTVIVLVNVSRRKVR